METMNATKRSVVRVGMIVCGGLAVAATGCRTRVVEHTRTVYVPAPAPVVVPAPQPPPPVVYAPPAPEPQPAPPVVVVPPPEQAPVVVIQSENDFYEPLATYGRWVVISSYGRCWVPARVEAGWRPYSNGYWQRTDAGWYWASDEPWGWATYHYGRWDFHPQYGWVWVPQTQWAPAWVSWREGGGYVGWAPLRPSVRIGVNVHIDDEPAFASRGFVFVEHRRMLEPVRPRTVIVNNTTIINKTVNITKVTVVNKTVINEGPRPDVIERESGRKVQAVPVREFRHKEEATVAARERNIPRGRDRKVEAPARIEHQAGEKATVPPPVVHHDEKPTVTQPHTPIATPTRPTPPRLETDKPARDEKKFEADNGRQGGTIPPTVKPESKPETKPAKAIPPRRDVPPQEKTAMNAKPMPQPVPANPIRDEQKREPVVEKKNPVTPPPTELKQGHNVSPDARREMKQPAKFDSTPQPAPKKQVIPSEKPGNKRLLSPREQSRNTGQTGDKVKKEENGNAKKKGEDQDAKPVDPTRAPQ